MMLISAATLNTLEKGRELAKKQIDVFMQEGICIDSFDNRVVGCYRISGESSKGGGTCHRCLMISLCVSREWLVTGGLLSFKNTTQ
tara:strand:+ start:16759 stop:17016 length:258 start_codon:yes stop_codon:yes gene_type:complete